MKSSWADKNGSIDFVPDTGRPAGLFTGKKKKSAGGLDKPKQFTLIVDVTNALIHTKLTL